MKPRHLLMLAGLVISSGLVLFGDKTPAGAISEPVTRPSAHAVVVNPVKESESPSRSDKAIAIQALLPRAALIGRADNATTGPLFANQSWTPPPPPPPPAKPAPPPPPSAPPLPFSYIGKKLENGHWEIYLARGEQTYIARDKGVIDGMYRVDAIQPPLLSFTYLPLHQVQTLSIGGLD